MVSYIFRVHRAGVGRKPMNSNRKCVIHFTGYSGYKGRPVPCVLVVVVMIVIMIANFCSALSSLFLKGLLWLSVAAIYS